MSADMPLRSLSDATLRDMAQGCTELTCLYHGAVNAERRLRAERNEVTS